MPTFTPWPTRPAAWSLPIPVLVDRLAALGPGESRGRPTPSAGAGPAVPRPSTDCTVLDPRPRSPARRRSQRAPRPAPSAPASRGRDRRGPGPRRGPPARYVRRPGPERSRARTLPGRDPALHPHPKVDVAPPPDLGVTSGGTALRAGASGAPDGGPSACDAHCRDGAAIGLAGRRVRRARYGFARRSPPG